MLPNLKSESKCVEFFSKIIIIIIIIQTWVIFILFFQKK